MSHYITRCCKTHGEWDMDSDFNSECPECEALGLTEIQQLRTALTFANQRAEAAEAERDAERDRSDELLILNEDLARDNESLDTELRIAEAERDALRKVDDSMVERAAKAEYFYQNEAPTWDDTQDDVREVYRDAARRHLDAALAVQP